MSAALSLLRTALFTFFILIPLSAFIWVGLPAEVVLFQERKTLAMLLLTLFYLINALLFLAARKGAVASWICYLAYVGLWGLGFAGLARVFLGFAQS